MVVFRIISALLGYLFGLFPTGVLYGNAHHVDIRSKGSGNTGTTNSLRVLGWKAGVIVFLGDCLKTVIRTRGNCWNCMRDLVRFWDIIFHFI